MLVSKKILHVWTVDKVITSNHLGAWKARQSNCHLQKVMPSPKVLLQNQSIKVDNHSKLVENHNFQYYKFIRLHCKRKRFKYIERTYTINEVLPKSLAQWYSPLLLFGGGPWFDTVAVVFFLQVVPSFLWSFL